MLKIFLMLCLFFNFKIIYASDLACSEKIPGYRVVKNSVFVFLSGREKACFFAFYTPNPQPGMGATGDGNPGDALWYAYYELKNPKKIYKFPMPSEDAMWYTVCTLDAVSFQDINYDNKREVTVIGSCDKSFRHYTLVFVFNRKNEHYFLDEKVYFNLSGFYGLTIADVKAYMKSPNAYYEKLRKENYPGSD